MAPDQATPGSGGTTTTSVRDELSADAGRLGDAARDRAREAAETRKSQVTETARSASSALGKAADDLDRNEGAPGWLSSAFRQTASGIERLAGDLDGRSADDLAHGVTRFARDNPVGFLAASAAAGFVAARFLKAGSDYRNEHRYDPPTPTERTDSAGMPVAPTRTATYGEPAAGGYSSGARPADVGSLGANPLQHGDMS